MELSSFGVPALSMLICILSYGSQLFFRYIAPSPLTPAQTIRFNLLVACIWICYFRACFTHPGRIPKEKVPFQRNSVDTEGAGTENDVELPPSKGGRWCRKCEAPKPPRAHHCKTCKRCIPKMDHHCPWTANCVSHRTYPHFFRFLFYGVLSMAYLEYFLYLRFLVIWRDRHLSSHLGPSPSQLVYLFIFTLINSIPLCILSILLVKNIYTVGANITTIEGWEIERHKAVVRRAKVLGGGYLDGPDGTKVFVKKQEFPYDIGILANIQQALGSSWPWVWLWPFAATPSEESGLRFEVNGFEDPSLPWPPPDPDRIPRRQRRRNLNLDKQSEDKTLLASDHNFKEAFQERQAADLRRRRQNNHGVVVVRQKTFHDRYSKTAGMDDDPSKEPYEENQGDDEEEGEEAWRNSDGEKLADFGVDVDVEFYDEDKDDGDDDEDDIPLSELLSRRRRRE